MDDYDKRKRQARSGRPYRRMVETIKREGAHVCWLCGMAIDMTLPPRTRMSWSMDHVVPLSMGGDPLDVANIREAHHGCNSARGNGTPGSSSNKRVW